jgi:hypothetical protein
MILLLEKEHEMDTEKKITRKRIDSDMFVKVWIEVANNNGTMYDVAEAIGCSLPGVGTKRKSLATTGIVLPDLRRGGKKSKVDVSGLNAYIQANLKK